ncbi:MAG TPA: GGDEF domain-containing protein, partial [Marinobacter adhaerens]|nr:GGDEF domain-containing protein [Marinobacter adhaerens]
MAQMAEKFLLSKLSRAGFVALIAIATLCAVLGEPMVAAAAAAAAGIVIAGKTFHPNRVHQPWPRIQQAFFVVLLLILLASFWTGPWILSHWLYALPLVAFALVPPAAAAVVTLIIAVLAMIATQWAVGLADRHQMISAFLLTLLLSALLVFLR